MKAETTTYQLTLEDASRFVMRNTRRGDRLTSIYAARRTHPLAANHRLKALRAHGEHPEGLTDFELADLTGIAQTSIGKRRHDLMGDGLIEKTTRTRPAPSGAAAIVWRITAKGVLVLSRSQAV